MKRTLRLAAISLLVLTMVLSILPAPAQAAVPELEARFIVTNNFLELHWTGTSTLTGAGGSLHFGGNRPDDRHNFEIRYVTATTNTVVNQSTATPFYWNLQNYALHGVTVNQHITTLRPTGLSTSQLNALANGTAWLTVQVVGTVRNAAGVAMDTTPVYVVEYRPYYANTIISQSGVPVRGSEFVHIDTLTEAARLVDLILDAMPEAVVANMRQFNQMVIFGPGEHSYNIPQHRSIVMRDDFRRAEGYGGRVAAASSANVLKNHVNPSPNYPRSYRSAYPNESIMAHEFGHGIQDAFNAVYASSHPLRQEFNAAFANVRSRNMWTAYIRDAGGGSEYFATMTSVWFDAMSEGNSANANTRAEFFRYDRKGHDFFAKIFPHHITELSENWSNNPNPNSPNWNIGDPEPFPNVVTRPVTSIPVQTHRVEIGTPVSAMNLPAFAQVRFGDNAGTGLPVTWDTTGLSSEEGVYTITGTIQPTSILTNPNNLTVTLSVVVAELDDPEPTPTPTPTPTPAPTYDNFVTIFNGDSNQIIEGFSGTNAVGGRIDLWGNWASDANDFFKQWFLVPDANEEYFQIRRMHTATATAPGGNALVWNGEGTDLTLAEPGDGDNQWWKLQRQPNGHFIITSRADPALAIAPNGPVAAETRLMLAPLDAANNTWRIEGDVPLERRIATAQAQADIRVPEGIQAGELALPATVRVTFADQTARDLPVTWDTSAFDGETPGRHTLTGTFQADGMVTNPANITVSLTVIVLRAGVIGLPDTDAVVPFSEGNIARDPAVLAYAPLGTPGIHATFSNTTNGAPSVQVPRINNGAVPTGTAAGNGWNCWGSVGTTDAEGNTKAATVSVTITWPEPYTVDATRIMFWSDTGATPMPPNDVFLEYWDGAAWVRISNLTNAAGAPVTSMPRVASPAWNGVTLDVPVTTERLRLTHTFTASTGNGWGIREWEIFGQLPEEQPSPGVDREALEEAIAAFEALDQALFFTASWAIAQTAYNAAVSVNNDEAASQEEVDAVANALVSAIEALVKAPIITITSQPESATRVIGESVTFSVTAEAEGGGNFPTLWFYQWRKDGVDIPGANGQTLTIPNVTPEDAGSYTASVHWNSIPAVGPTPYFAISEAAILTVVEPEIDRTALKEAMSAFEALDGTLYLSWLWNRALTAYSAAVAVDNNEAATQEEIDAAVGALVYAIEGLHRAPIITVTSQPESATRTVGESVTFSVSAEVNDDFIFPAFWYYQWQKDGVDIPGATGQTLTIPYVTPEDAGSYTVSVHWNSGMPVTWTQYYAISEAAILTVTEPEPIVPITLLRLNMAAITRVARETTVDIGITVNEGASTAGVILTTSNPAMATISEDGKSVITGTRAGTVTLTATYVQAEGQTLRHSVTLMIT